MAFTWTTGEYNVVGSLNRYFANNIGTNLPTFFTAARVNFNYPNEPLFPSGATAQVFSVSYLSSFEEMLSQGDLMDAGKRGQRRHGLAAIDCWVNALDNYNWQRDLFVMTDMVTKLFSINRTIQIVDMYGGGTSNTGYTIRIERVDGLATTPDPNPNIKRQRLMLHYTYGVRQ